MEKLIIICHTIESKLEWIKEDGKDWLEPFVEKNF